MHTNVMYNRPKNCTPCSFKYCICLCLQRKYLEVKIVDFSYLKRELDQGQELDKSKNNFFLENIYVNLTGMPQLVFCLK